MKKKNQWSKYENWTDWRTDPRKHCMVDGHCVDISHYYWNLSHPNDKIRYDDGHCIHHPNRNHWDNSPENQMKMTKSEHIIWHNKNRSEETKMKRSEALKGENNPNFGKTGEKNPFFGKHHSPETIALISTTNSKKVIANFVEYSSGREAAKSLGVSPTMIRNRILANKPGYRYL